MSFNGCTDPIMSPALKKKGRDDLGAGLRVSKDNIAAHPAGPPRYGELTQAERAFTLASTFLSGVLAYAYLVEIHLQKS
jgi:hypothetical protein